MKSIKQLSFLTLLVAGPLLMAANSGDVMTELGIEEPKLRQDVLLNLKETNYFFFNSTNSIRQAVRQLPESARAATVRTLGKAVRAYVESSSFKQTWLQDLRTYYPYDETYTEEYIAKKKQTDQAERSVAQGQFSSQMSTMDQAFSQMDPAMLKMAAQAQLSREEQELASLSGSDRTSQAQHVAAIKKMMALPPAEFKKQYLASLKQQMQASMNHANNEPELDKERLVQERKQKAEFDAHSDFRPQLKQRLQAFITLSETVDFDARLVPMGRKQEFANPVYQRKPAEWKFLYRIGKEPVAEARLFAKQWLSELH
jgi:O6-methylguanine-DNA--protein-cysteine methyltransferase